MLQVRIPYCPIVSHHYFYSCTTFLLRPSRLSCLDVDDLPIKWSLGEAPLGGYCHIYVSTFTLLLFNLFAQYAFADSKRVIAEYIGHSRTEQRYYCFG